MTKIPYTGVKIPYTDRSADPETDVVLEIGKKHGIDEAMIIYTSKVEVKDWVLLKCKYGCKSYGKSYCCPPHSIPPADMRNILREYKRAVLVVGKAKNEEERAKVRKALTEMEKELCLRNYYKAFALVPGCCEKCDTCNAVKGNPCRDPKNKRPCIDGTGIDVFALVRKYKKNLQTAEDMNKAPESYGLILLD